MGIKKVNTAIRVAELDTLSDAIVRRYAAYSAELSTDTYLADTMATIETQSEELTAAILQSTALSNLEAADKVRDEYIRQLAKSLEGYASLPIETLSAPGERLKNIFNVYGRSMTKENYATESSHIASLLQDFKTDEAQADIAALQGISEIVEGLTAAQEAFNVANDEYKHAISNRSVSATTIKKSLVQSLNAKLIPYLTAMVLANSTTYGSFAADVETEIQKANEIVVKRAKANEEGDEDAEDYTTDEAGEPLDA